MTLETIVAHYGLPALFLGAGLEGEAVVVSGGLLAHQGLLPLPGVMAAAAAGSFVADPAWFAIGRRFRDHRWVKKARSKPAFDKALDALERHPIGFIFAFRFIYGFRTVSPIAIGTTKVRERTFLAVNAVAAIIWGIAFSAIGYVFGNAFETFIGKLRGQHLALMVGGIVVLGLIVAGIFWWWRERRS